VTLTLRDYQHRALDDLRDQLRAARRRILLLAPTGSGKTVIASSIVHGAQDRGRRVLFLAHRKELIDQCSRKLDAIGVDHGVMQGDHPRRRPWLPVQVASVQTLIRREMPWSPDLIIIDEAHRAVAASYQEICAAHPQAIVIGLTATPVRSDGKGLGNQFDVMVSCPSVAEMIRRGYLVPIRAWTHPSPNLKGVRKVAGDYDLGELAVRMNKTAIIGDLVTTWRRHAANRQTVVFAVNVEHSKAITQQFNAAGVRAEHLDGTTPERERDAILARLAAGETRVVSNCAVLTEGWDCPITSCVIIARPTMSAGLYLQMAGRALRPHPASGKRDCIVLDHGGCIRQHGLVDADREWSLETGCAMLRSSGPRISLADTFRICPDCYAVHPPDAMACPCGYVFSARRQPIRQDSQQSLIEARQPEIQSPLPESQRRRQFEFWLYQQRYLHTKTGKPFAPRYPEARYRAQFGGYAPKSWRSEWEQKQRNRQAS
jgi:superfamily II DNA or RNA helicase